MSFNLSASCISFPMTIFSSSDCSGNGICSFDPQYGRAVCNCFQGYRGNSDFRTSSSLVDCHLNDSLILSFWIIVLIFGIFTGCYSSWIAYLLVSHHRSQNEMLIAKGKEPHSILKNKAFASLIPFHIIGYPCLMIIALLKITNQANEEIGLAWDISIFWIIYRSVFFVTAMRFQPSLIASLLRGQRAIDGVLKQNDLLATIILIFAIIPNFYVLIPLLTTPEDPFDFFWGNFSFFLQTTCTTFMFIACYFQSKYAMRKIDEVLIASYEITKNPITLSTAKKLTELQRKYNIQQIFQTFLHLFITCFPFMWTKYDYIFPIQAFFICFTHFVTIKLVRELQLESPINKKVTTTMMTSDASRGDVLPFEGSQ